MWGYRYDESNNLEFVDNPDGTTRQYHYEDADYPNALTGITDERGVRYSTFSYDAQGRAILSTHAGDAQRVDIAYNDISGSRTVTNSSGEVSTYTSISQFGLGLVKGISGPGCSTCSNGNTSYDYDPATNDLLSKTENGVTTQYGNYDTKGQYGYKIEAVGTPEERRTDYTYDPRYYNKITTKTESSVATGNSKVTTYTYDDFGNRTSVTIDGFRPDGAAVSRTTTYQYNGPLHQLSQIDGPRTDVTDITTLDYYANDPVEGYNRGRLQRITGPAGIVLRDNIEYTATGKVLSEDRPNGVSLAYTYYAGNDRLETLTETAGGISRVTRWTYLATGEVETITQADGTALATTTRLVYDDARRLVGMIDQLGNHIDYTLDTEGNRIDEKVFDSANVLYKSVQQTFDIYNRLDTRTLVDEIIDYNFQPDGSLGDSINAKNVTTVFQYDALKRLTSTTGDVGGLDPDTQDTLTQYIYDAGDRLTSVTSPNNSNTTYSYDDLGNLLSEVSPDRGTRSYTYDEAGNVATITDARNITVSYSYDALNRVYSIDYPGTAEDVSLTYDTAMGCNNGIGKLCTVTDNSGTTTYSYDGFGNLAQQYKTELSVTYTTAYSYDALNRVEKLTLSDGRTVDYGYDALGRITSIDATVNGAQQTLAHNIQYRPDGLLTDIEFGNGFAETRLYNLKARLTTQTMPTGPANTAPSVLSTIPDQVGTESVAFNYTVPAGTFVDADAGDILTYSASLAGDAPLPAWLNFASASQTFSGTPASADVGTLSVQVTATDTGALTASTTFNLTINAAAANVITGADTNDYLTGSTAADNIYGLNGNDILNGGNGDDRLYGDDGDDSLNGGNDNDTLVGGAGNDSLNGGKGADTYRFSQGFGQDTLSDYDYTAGVVDRIVFDASITAADVNFTRIGNKLICSVGANGDSITSNNWFINAYYRIEEITFDDGSPMITADDVYRATLTFSGTAANDTLYGDYLADNMSALEGNDNLYGYNGDDLLDGGPGNDYLYGHNDNDTLIGGTGNDRLYGYSGADTYRFALGDGQDIISEYDTSGSTDRIVFDASVTSSDVSFSRTANGLTISYGASGDTITASTWFNSPYYRIEEITFDDGSPMITADDVYRATLTFSGTAANDTLYGDYLADNMSALEGNDNLYGYNGDDLLDGGPGNDYLYGHNDNDTLIGGAGNDRLYGSTGADTYRFTVGDGQDIISEYDASGSVDQIIFGPGITPAGMSYTQTGNDLILAYAAGDQVTVSGWFVNDYYKMEQIVFDDGTVLTPTDIAPLVAAVTNPAANDRHFVQRRVPMKANTDGAFIKVGQNAGSFAETSPSPLSGGEHRGEGKGSIQDRLMQDRLMVVTPNSSSPSGYQVWQKGPATANTWLQTATDPNAYDRPATVAYLTMKQFALWQQQAAGDGPSYKLQWEDIMDRSNALAQWQGEERGEGRYIKVNHGGTAPTAGPIDSDTWTYTYDANGNMETITDSTGARVYGYDALDRLTSDTQPSQPTDTLGYDRNGNRTSISDGVASLTSVYLPNSNQLDTLNGSAITHDLAGNHTSDNGGNRTFEYNNGGRLFKVYEGSTLIATYTYNYQGQRTRKVTPTGTTVYHYDLNGSLISETDELGAPIRDIVYRDTVPIAQIDTGLTAESITYLHTDHLGTPRRGTDENGVVVWAWESDAFGAAAANDDVDGDGVSTVVNLRFAGQYYDGETGLHYNYNRYYDPSTGRYITSDPSGIDGGINTFLYANANPLYWTDPLGLCPGVVNTGWFTGRAGYQTLPGGRQREYSQGRMRLEGTLISGGDCVSECGNSSGWTTCTYLATIHTMSRTRTDDLATNTPGSWSGWSSPVSGRAQTLTIGYNCETGEWRTP